MSKIIFEDEYVIVVPSFTIELRTKTSATRPKESFGSPFVMDERG